MAGLTENGFVVKTFGEVITEVRAYLTEHVFAGIDTADDSPLGQVLTAILLQVARLWEVAQQIEANKDPEQASGWGLDAIASITGTYRSSYSKTVVPNVTVVLAANASLPAGSLANLTERPSVIFHSMEEVTGSVIGGSFLVDFEAEEDGPIDVEIGQLNEINVASDGWLSVNNTEEGVTGTAPETDEEFREKRLREISIGGSARLAAIVSAVSAVDGVLDVRGKENDTNGVVDGIPGSYIRLIVRGGVNADIANAIYLAKGNGTGTFGTTQIAVSDTMGESHIIRFFVAEELPFYCTLTVVTDENWQGDVSIAEVKAAIVSYVSGKIGDDVLYEKVRAFALVVDGVHSISSCYIGITSPPTGTSNINVTVFQAIVGDIANIQVYTT